MRSLHYGLCFAALLMAAAHPVGAELVDFSDARLTITIGPLVLAVPGPVSGTGVNVSRSSGGAVTRFTFPASAIRTTGFVVPVTDPAAVPIRGLQATLANAAGSFGLGTAGGFGGSMQIRGVEKVCFFSPCDMSPSANLSVPLSVVGTGGTATAMEGVVNVTVKGAGWTTGMITLPEFATTMNAEFRTGSRVQASQGTHLNLVTPIYISTNINPSQQLPGYGRFEVFLERLLPERTVTLCHKQRRTLTVASQAGDVHLGHGDTLGACPLATIPRQDRR